MHRIGAWERGGGEDERKMVGKLFHVGYELQLSPPFTLELAMEKNLVCTAADEGEDPPLLYDAMWPQHHLVAKLRKDSANR